MRSISCVTCGKRASMEDVECRGRGRLVIRRFRCPEGHETRSRTSVHGPEGEGSDGLERLNRFLDELEGDVDG